jgi:DUF1680 family protein
MYITGGIGSSGDNEGFTKDYDLPNEDAYCETCASVGMVFWNQRMNLLTGESKYIDVLERSLYNGALDGLSLSGDRFFYGNPLESNGGYARSEWFGTACCPANIARLVASLGNYIYAKSDDGIYINLFVGSNTNVDLQNGNISIQQTTNYPWDGNVQINVSPDHPIKYKLFIRIPGWAQNQPVPGNTYLFLQQKNSSFNLSVNNRPANYAMQNGYAVIEREWKKNDVINLNLSMNVRRVIAIDSIKEDRNKVALQRGPLMYCIEAKDNEGKAMNIILPDNVKLTSNYNANLLNGVVTITGEAPAAKANADGTSVVMTQQKFTAIPYYAWANRGENEMQVWIPRKINEVKVTVKE